MKRNTAIAFALGIASTVAVMGWLGTQPRVAEAQAQAPAPEAAAPEARYPMRVSEGTSYTGRFKVVATYANGKQDSWINVIEWGQTADWLYIRLEQRPGRFGAEDLIFARDNLLKVQIWPDQGEKSSSE